MSMVPKAIAILVEALTTDPEYQGSWQANIAMSFYDEFRNQVPESVLCSTDLHRISNDAADRFLRLMCYDVKPQNNNSELKFEGLVRRSPILGFFRYKHLPPHLQAKSALFCDLAEILVEDFPDNEERAVALRKLLEAKDAAVRSGV